MDAGTDVWKMEKENQVVEVIPQTDAGPQGGGDFVQGIRTES